MKQIAFKSKFIWNGHEVKQLNNIGFPEIKTDMADVTTHDSEGGFKEWLMGLKDVGEFTVSGYFAIDDTDGQIAMYDDYLSDTLRNASIKLGTSGAELAFSAYLTGCSFGPLPVNDGIPFSATVKITGKPTLTITTATGLTNLVITGADLVPAFDVGVYTYVATALTATASVKVTPTAAGTIKVNGDIVGTGDPSGDIALGLAGSITKITIVVTEENKAPKEYVISVVRAAS